MAALITARGLPFREDEPEYPAAVASLAWKIADAMQAEHRSRANRGGK